MVNVLHQLRGDIVERRRFGRFIRLQATKIRLIVYKGSLCRSCGVDLTLRPWLAQFHHRDPKQKSFGIGASIGNSGQYSDMLAELDKCDLLCCACHLTTHFDLPLFTSLETTIRAKAAAITFDYWNLDASDIQNIKDRATRGMSIKQIAIELNISPPSVRKHYPRTIKVGNDKRRKITDDEIRTEISAGRTLRDIAHLYGLSYKTVWKRYRKILDKKSPPI